MTTSPGLGIFGLSNFFFNALPTGLHRWRVRQQQE
jgi:hypothetical protein